MARATSVSRKRVLTKERILSGSEELEPLTRSLPPAVAFPLSYMNLVAFQLMLDKNVSPLKGDWVEGWAIDGATVNCFVYSGVVCSDFQTVTLSGGEILMGDLMIYGLEEIDIVASKKSLLHYM